MLFSMAMTLTAQIDYVKRVNCGNPSSAFFEGKTFDGDISVPGEVTFDGENTINSSYVTLDQPFKSARYTDNPAMHYRFTVENGHYRVLLYFVEVHHGVAPNTDPSTRVFDFDIEGQYSETDLNPISAAGGANQIYMIDQVVEVQDGELTLTFYEVNNDPIINAIEVLGVDLNSSDPGGYWTQTAFDIHYTNGSVGIGTSTVPTGYKLVVDGHIRTREIRVDQDTWPDYVFSDDYELLSLDEIKKYIEEYGHLPNIPPATVVEQNGVEVGEMNRLLLEKIEELTLYIIEQHTNQQMLEKRILELEKVNE